MTITLDTTVPCLSGVRLVQPGHVTQFLSLTLLAFGVIFVVLNQNVIPPILAFHDPVTIRTPRGSEYCCLAYYGAVSNLGVMLWTSASAVCLFAGMLLALHYGVTRSALTLLAGGVLSGVLAVDDLFLLHDDLLPFHGVDEKITFAVYGVGILSYLFFCRADVLRGNLLVLATSLAFFGMSTVADLIQHHVAYPPVLLEEVAKFIGVVFWAGFHVLLAFMLLAGEPLKD